MNVIFDKTVKSKVFLKAKMRLPFQTTEFVYKALDIAENQIEEQFNEIEKLKLENLRLSKLLKRK